MVMSINTGKSYHDKRIIIVNQHPMICFYSKLLLILTILFSKTVAQTLPMSGFSKGKVKAVSIEEIKKYGVLTNGYRKCDDDIPIKVFASSNIKEIVGEVSPGIFVKYERLSELSQTPVWAARPEYRLQSGEKFQIQANNLTGWVDEKYLMTFTSEYREGFNTKWCLERIGNALVCFFVSDQGSYASCSVLTVWENIPLKLIWELKDVIREPIGLGLYTFPRIDSLYYTSNDSLFIEISAKGGDVDDRWGSISKYLYNSKKMSHIKTTNINDF